MPLSEDVNRPIPDQLRFWAEVIRDVALEQSRTRNEVTLQTTATALEVIAERLERRPLAP